MKFISVLIFMVGLAPLYAALSGRKLISCSMNDTVIMIQNFIDTDDNSAVIFEIGLRSSFGTFSRSK